MLELRDALRTDAPDTFHAHAADHTPSVAVPFDVLEAILAQPRRSLPWRRRETGGVLIGAAGNSNPVRVRIDAAVEVPCGYVFGPAYSLGAADKKAVRTTIDAHTSSGSQVVGFYRTHARKGLALDADDLLFLSEFFPGPRNVVLLIKPRLFGEAVGAFFFSGASPETSRLDFAVNRRARRVRNIGPAPSQPAAATAPRQQARPRGPLWCSRWVQTPLFALVLAACGFLGFISGRELNRVAPKQPAPRDPYGLSMTVLEYGDNLHLIWDHDSPAVQRADRGEVSITDGAQSKTIALDAGQLRQGSVIYRAITKSVFFRLEVFLNGNQSVAEMWPAGRRAPAASAQ